MFLHQFESRILRAPDGEAPAAPAAETPASGTEAPPSGDAPPAGGGETTSGTETTAAASGQETTSGAAGDDALAVVPETADAYAFTPSEDAAKILGDMSNDPALKTLREAAKEKGWTQGQFNERIVETVNILASKGLLQANFDPAAEVAKLSEGGKDGKARQQEVQVFADSLKARGDITDVEYGELMSLMPTAAGVNLVEKLRAMSTKGGAPIAPGGGDGNVDALAQARAMRLDPKYETDPTYRRQADAAYMAATKK